MRGLLLLLLAAALRVASHSLEALGSAGKVCLAEAFAHLADTLAGWNVSVHVLLLASSAEDCVTSLYEIERLLPRVGCSCALLKGVAPLVAAHATRERLRAKRCRVAFAHEFWAPLREMYTDRLLSPEDDGPTLVSNFMGGELWSSSWDVRRRTRYADWMIDYSERSGGFGSDLLVFTNQYFRAWHSSRWTLRGTQLVVPNIASTDHSLRRRFNTSVPLPVTGVAFVSAVDKRKGIGELIDALLRLPDLPLITVHIIGSLGAVDGEEAAAYIERRLSSASHVRFTVHGPMPNHEVWAFVKEQQLLLVLPSLLENQPTTISLAALHEVPTLYYDTGGCADMVTAESAARMLLPPDSQLLTSRLRACLTDGVGYAPVLRESMYEAKDRWLDAITLALSFRPALPARSAALEMLTYTRIQLHASSTSELVAAAAAAAAPLVLLYHSQYELSNTSGSALLAVLLALSENAHVGGFVGLVEAADGGILTPAGPFFYPSREWSVCGPEAPLFVRTELLKRYLEGHKGQPFRQWIFTAWLIYQEREMVLQAPQTLFRFTGCFDIADCFSAELKVGSPHLGLASNELRAFHAPNAPHTLRNASYAVRMNATCSTLDRSYDDNWAAAAHAPIFCNGTVEHGAFTLASLRASIAYLPFCGAHCIPNLAVVPQDRAAPHGWHLDWKERCWYEISREHTICAAHLPQQLKVFPAGLACSSEAADRR